MASFTGFFSQQLIQFQDCFEKDTTAVVSISRCNSYARTGGHFQNTTPPVEFAPMAAAINVGVIQPIKDLTNVLSSGCISGNCSVPATEEASFSTIAISRSCEDITAHIRTVNESTDIRNRNWTQGYLALDFGNNRTFEWPKMQGATVLKSWAAWRSGLITINFVFRSSSFENYAWKAVNCTLFPTVDTYAASIRNSILEEVLVESIPLQNTASQFSKPPGGDYDHMQELFWWRYKMTTDSTIRNGVQASCIGSENATLDHVKFMKKSDDPTYVNATGQTTESAGWKWWYYPRDCIWSISSLSVSAIYGTLGEIFNEQEALMGTRNGVGASAHMRQIFLDGNMTFDTVNKRIKDLATSMTAVVRAYGDNGDDTPPDSAKGEMWINTACIYTRWPWVTFPVVMIGLTGIFLMLVMIENRGIEHDRLWKSSFLAALLCEVQTQDRPVGKAEMLATAESTSVSLEGKNSAVRRLIAH